MNGKIRYKIPGGKLLSIDLSYSEDHKKIKDISITGDFFVYPEEAIEQLEETLKEKSLDQNTLQTTITDFIRKEHVQLIGIGPESITQCILRCMK